MTQPMGNEVRESHRGTTEIDGNMAIDWDVAIPTRDGSVLRADVFRPAEPGEYPVVLTHGPYGKWLGFEQGFPWMWEVLERDYPEIVAGSSNKYLNWETPDPERWVPHGYVIVRVDSRGASRSEGFLEVFSPKEAEDYYDCVEWCGTREWSNGKVGLLGISYYAVGQWAVASLKPPHLAAMCPWEGYADYYREFMRHGGILDAFFMSWYPQTVDRIQHGIGERGVVSSITGEWVGGPETLTPEELRANRPDYFAELREHKLLDEYHRARTPDLSQIDVPLLSAGNWAHHLHTRGNIEGYQAVSSEKKWLQLHGLEHWVLFYDESGLELQRRFFDHFLKGEDNGWDQNPPIMMELREVDGSFTSATAQAWPLPDTEWRSLAIDAAGESLGGEGAADTTMVVPPDESGVTFWTEPVAERTQITGPLAATVYVSTEQPDVDVFLTLRVQDENGKDVRLRSAVDPRGVVTLGWLRASQRSTNPERSLPYRPWRDHHHVDPVVAGEVMELEVEIWPTSLVVPAGYRIGLTVTGQDFQFPIEGGEPELYGMLMRGQGCFMHDDPADRPAEIFQQPFTLHTGPSHPSRLLLPVIPSPAERETVPQGRMCMYYDVQAIT